MPQQHTIIILGSGPAGLSAAIYAARAQLSPLVIRGRQPGGQLTTTTLVENYPGFANGIEGPQLMEAMEAQARWLGAEILDGEVTGVNLQTQPLAIQMHDETLYCQTLIIASGASPRPLGLPNEQELYGRGVSVCATCDGFFYRGQEVAVVGGGNSAVVEALFLTRFATRVHLIHRRNQLRAAPSLTTRALSNDKIVFHWEQTVDSLLGDRQTGLTGLRLRHLPSGHIEELNCAGLFVAIGHVPNTALFAGQLELDKEGFIVTAGKSTATNIPGVFAAGDVQEPLFRQAITAAASGCRAALEAERFLSGLS